LKEGRGQGTGAEYVPWVHIHDFSSSGMVSRIKGSKTGRVHHFMSNLEVMFFYLLDWSDEVLDIREQFPLIDICDAIEIADKAQIRYPYDMKSGFPYVMTSDFFVDTIDAPTVITVKPSAELSKPRVREKLEIERRYWSIRNIRWRVVTENQINKTKAKNIEWLSQAKDLSQFGLIDEEQSAYKAYFMICYAEDMYNLGGIVSNIEREFQLPPGMGLNIFKHLAFWKQIAFDVYDDLHHTTFNEKKKRQDVLSA
jgi:hypothetical protein